MWTGFKHGTLGAASLVFAASLWTSALAGPPEDWGDVPSTTLMLYYPGQSDYEWLRTPEHKRAFKETEEGKGCAECHELEEEDLGSVTAGGERLEPHPLEDKNAVVELEVQAAYDDENLYWRFSWATQGDHPFRAQDYMRFDGESWVRYGGAAEEEKVRDGDEPVLSEDRLAIMLDDGKVPMFAGQGCWLTCHNSMDDMPEQPGYEKVKDHAVLGKLSAGIYFDPAKRDIHKYLPGSRTDGSGWDKVKSADEIKKLKADGQFVDFMQWGAARSNPVGMADDGYVLEYRVYDAGQIPFSWNIDRKSGQPLFMFDEGAAGAASLTEDDLGDPDKPYALIKGENTAPFDPDAGWEEGAILPGYVISREDAKGSAADNADVVGEWEDGTWTVVWTRPLDTGHPEDDKILEEGGVYNVGFAVHDAGANSRFHFTAFPVTLGIGTEATIEAAKVE